MNRSTTREMSHYESQENQSIEKVILAEDVKFSTLEAIEGKFFLPSMTPSMEMTDMSTKKTRKYTESNFFELVIPPHLLLIFMKGQIIPVTELLNLLIHEPKLASEEAVEQEHVYDGPEFVLTFASNEFVIPKGTEFLVEFLGGNMEIDLMSIIGIFSIPSV